MKKILMFSLLCIGGVFITGCPSNNSGTSPQAPTPTPTFSSPSLPPTATFTPSGTWFTSTPTSTFTPTASPTPTPISGYGYLDFDATGTCNTNCGVWTYIDGVSFPANYGQGVCSKQLPVGSHAVSIAVSGNCVDSTACRLYYGSSYSPSWTWNINVQAGMDYYFSIYNGSVSFSACGPNCMSYIIQPILPNGTWTGSCFQ